MNAPSSTKWLEIFVLCIFVCLFRYLAAGIVRYLNCWILPDCLEIRLGTHKVEISLVTWVDGGLRRNVYRLWFGGVFSGRRVYLYVCVCMIESNPMDIPKSVLSAWYINAYGCISGVCLMECICLIWNTHQSKWTHNLCKWAKCIIWCDSACVCQKVKN